MKMKFTLAILFAVGFILTSKNYLFAQNTATTDTIINTTTQAVTSPTVNGNLVAPQQVSKSNFLTTFVKTPFVILTLAGLLFCTVFAGLFEFFANIFTLFDYGFPALKSIWDMGWNNIIVNWWWKPGVGWHLAISILLILAIGNRSR